MTTKLLPLIKKTNGITLNQVWRDDQFAIYHEAGTRNYELIAIRVVKYPKDNKYAKNEEGYSKYEKYPVNKDWGSYGWTYFGKMACVAKMNQVKAERLARKAAA